MNIKIICDTMSNIDMDFAKKHNVDMLPLRVLFNGEEYLDGIDIDSKEFTKMLKESDSMPMTAQVPMKFFLESFTKYLEQGDIVLYIGGSSRASGTFQSALITAETIDNPNLYLVDSMNIAIGSGALIYKAVELVEEGLDITDVINKLESYKKDIFLEFTVSTLEYLKKGGRISFTKATVGTILNINPIIGIHNGLPKSIEHIRGNKKIFNKMVNNAVNNYNGGKILILYGENIEEGLKFKQALKEKLNILDDLIEFIYVGIGIASHTGPYGYGVAFIK